MSCYSGLANIITISLILFSSFNCVHAQTYEVHEAITQNPLTNVAETPAVLPKPVKLKKYHPNGLTTTNQAITQPSTNMSSAIINDCQMRTASGNNIVLNIGYSVNPSIGSPIYIGAFIYESTNKAVNAGYIPNQLNTLPQGTANLVLTLPNSPFNSQYIESFLMYSGKIITKEQFAFPFTWNGKNGQFVNQTEPNQPSTQQDSKQSFCSDYAMAAANQFNLGKEQQVPGVTHPVWSNNLNAHYSWCLENEPQVVMQHDKARANYLLQNLPPHVLSNMKMEGRKIPSLDPGLGP